ncbi:MAG: thioredoxin-dependent thiol peroxidase [Anaerolineales bacterium]|nr:thioredoxin-dependent thiol peroxidase [Anaerolineales bacterium]MCX7754295.1 thioredoxin-dependent thiol peroxidase [Anaerolineales bacterium]MDW8278670.1 thioredoxin-dependent thiol peroxidase [Anaerolineales bacterium]
MEEQTMIPTPGTPAPDFALPDETGAVRRLADFRGQTIVLYFYPKDDTPGCTTEACNFRDDYSAYQEAGVTILGVSPDSPKSHARFKEKFQLPFSLLADEDHRVCEAYGVWGQKKFMGKDYMGVLRTTFIIDPEGRVKKVFENVKPAEHSVEVLAAVRE